MLTEDGKYWIEGDRSLKYDFEGPEIGTTVTVSITKDDWYKPATLPKLWGKVDYYGRRGIVYRIRKTVDEDGQGTTLSIKGWKESKYKLVNWIKLLWLKIRVKLNLI